MTPHLIIIDGPDGTGKSTLVGHAVKALLDHDVSAVSYRDPGSTCFGEKIRELLLDRSFQISTLAQLYAFSAARAEMLVAAGEQIRKGVTVLLDRCWASTLAYQCFGENFEKSTVLDNARYQLMQTIPLDTPIVNVFLGAPASVCNKRLADTGKEADRFEHRDAEYYTRVRHGYSEAALHSRTLTTHTTYCTWLDASNSLPGLLDRLLHFLHTIHPSFAGIKET